MCDYYLIDKFDVNIFSDTGHGIYIHEIYRRDFCYEIETSYENGELNVNVNYNETLKVVEALCGVKIGNKASGADLKNDYCFRVYLVNIIEHIDKIRGLSDSDIVNLYKEDKIKLYEIINC